MPFPPGFPLAFDGKLLGQVLRIFTDTVTSWYWRRPRERGLPDGEVTVVPDETSGELDICKGRDRHS